MRVNGSEAELLLLLGRMHSATTWEKRINCG
jgi:hypothetical protein